MHFYYSLRILLSLLIYTELLVSNYALTLLARTQRSISLLTIDPSINVTSSVAVLVSSISEDLSVLLAVNIEKGIGYFTARNHLYSIVLSTGSSVDIGKIGFGIEDTPTSIAIDWITNQVYIGLSGVGHDSSARIYVCLLDDVTNCSVIIHSNLEYLYSITLDPLDGNIYWLNGVTNSIEKAFMNGQHHDKHPYHDQSSGSSSSKGVTYSFLTLHPKSRRLYFVKTQIKSSEIWFCELYKRDSCEAIIETELVLHFSVSESYLIWSTNHPGYLVFCTINDCKNTKVAQSDLVGVESFVVVDPSIQPKRINPNPCARYNGGCSHFCLLLHFHPWAYCACPVGIRLLENKKTCDPDGVDKILLVSAVSGLYYISLDTSDFTPRQILYEGFDQDKTHKFYDIDFDPISRKVYWMDAGTGHIRRCYLNGSATEDVLSVSNSVRSFRLDFEARNIYWIDSKLARIYVSKLESSYTKVIVSKGLNKPQALTLDLTNRHIYFTDLDEASNTIQRVTLDGKNRTIIVKHSSYSWPNGVVVDGFEGRVYWTEGNYSLIKTAMLDGSEEHQIGHVSLKLPQPYAITKLGAMLFCNSLAGRSLIKISIDLKNGSIISEVVESSIYGPVGLFAVSLHSKYIVKHPCRNSNCDHICVFRANGEVSCLCSSGFELQKDGHTCKQPSGFLVLGQATISDIIRMSLAKPINNESIGIAHMNDPPIDFDIDQRGNYLIFAGSISGGGYIKRVPMYGDIAETVFSGSRLDGIYSIGVDWISRNIYWTNTQSNRIEVCDYSGQFVRTLAWKGISPTDIVIYSTANSVFFVNIGVNVTIKRMPLSGQPNGGIDIVGDLSTVRSLAIDTKREQLYWSESDSHIAKVSVSRLDGSNRELLFVGTDQTPHKLFYFNYKLYYSDDKNNIIGYYDEKRFITLHEGIYNVTTLLIYHGRPPIQLNDCAIEKSQCPQLCLPSDNVRMAQTGSKMLDMCACTDHSTFDQSSQTCKDPENSIIIGCENQFLIMNLRRHSDRSFSWMEDPIITLSLPSIGLPYSFSFDPLSRLLFWIDAKESGYIKYMAINAPYKVLTYFDRHNCSIFHSLAVDDTGRLLYASCQTRSSYGYIHVFKIQDGKNNLPLQYIGIVVSGKEISLVTGHSPVPRDIAVLPQSNYLFYVDVSPFLHSPAIVQCQLDGRKCEAWLSKDLWPGTRIHADATYLKLFYTCPSGVWSRDVGMATSNIRHYYISPNASEYGVAPVDGGRILIAEISSRRSKVVDIATNSTINLPNNIVSLQRFSSTPSRVCRDADCSHMCRFVRDSRRKHECMCPLGYAISSENPSVCMPNVPCQFFEFACDDGQSCIHSAKKCDKVPDCTDGSDESTSLCRNVSPDRWPCDDGTSTIERTLLCNGQVNCDDGSDERHCRCSSPSQEIDCGAFPLLLGGECVRRSLVCDGFPDCENAADENPKMCAEYPHPTMRYQSSPEWLYIVLLGIIVFLSISFVIFCCFRNHPLCTSRTDMSPGYRINSGAEASILLPSNPECETQVELRTYSVVTSTSSYPALPPPNSARSGSIFSSRDHSSKKEIPPNRFYAPPPSAASLSTYGVVKPADVRLPNSTARQRLRKKKVTSPPPSYSQIEHPSVIASVTGFMDGNPQMCSTPKSRRAVNSQTRSPLLSFPNSPSIRFVPCNSRIPSSDSSSEPRPSVKTCSTSSLSTHSSAEGPH